MTLNPKLWFLLSAIQNLHSYFEIWYNAVADAQSNLALMQNWLESTFVSHNFQPGVWTISTQLPFAGSES